MIRIKGSVILARRAFVEKHFGEDAWRRLLAAVSEDDRQELEGIKKDEVLQHLLMWNFISSKEGLHLRIWESGFMRSNAENID